MAQKNPVLVGWLARWLVSEANLSESEKDLNLDTWKVPGSGKQLQTSRYRI